MDDVDVVVVVVVEDGVVEDVVDVDGLGDADSTVDDEAIELDDDKVDNDVDDVEVVSDDGDGAQMSLADSTSLFNKGKDDKHKQKQIAHIRIETTIGLLVSRDDT